MYSTCYRVIKSQLFLFHSYVEWVMVTRMVCLSKFRVVAWKFRRVISQMRYLHDIQNMHRSLNFAWEVRPCSVIEPHPISTP